MADSTLVQRVLQALAEVQMLRETHQQDPGLGLRVQALKQFQQRRFARTYADLLCSPRYGSAARFFLEELYGPGDQTVRDAQFARVVPSVVRLFPEAVGPLVEDLVGLHALSEQLDDAMARRLEGAELSAASYRQAWLAVGQTPERQRQLQTVLGIGRDLDRLTRHRWIRQGIVLMRPAAAAAGLGDLQKFLESGLNAFSAMRGAEEFLMTIKQRETGLMEALFSGSEEPGRWLQP